MHASRMLPRSIWRLAISLVAVAQLSLGFAPIVDGQQGPDARAHIDQAGTTLHHAHNPANCAACTARGLIASAIPREPDSVFFALSTQFFVTADSQSARSAWVLAARPRAPPAASV